MKKNTLLFVYGILIGLLHLPLAVSANGPQAFDRDQFMKEGLQTMTSSLSEHLKDSAYPSDPTCPAPGLELYKNVRQKTGKIFAALDAVRDIMGTVKPIVHEKRDDQSKCGSCQQNNMVSYYASISPQQVQPILECEGRPAQTITADLQDKEDVESFTDQVLNARNSEGKRILRACADPCSYYITSSETSLDNGKTHLTLTIQCGPPRKKSIFSAIYDFKGGLVHQWTCSK